jgi:hypothetical protein
MSNDRTGGPAFPCLERGDSGVNLTAAGLTKREYFIAHAPAEPQPWFEPVMLPRPSTNVWVSDDGARTYASRAVAEREEGECCGLLNQKELDEWTKDWKKQLYVQWPAAWADAMIEESKK